MCLIQQPADTLRCVDFFYRDHSPSLTSVKSDTKSYKWQIQVIWIIFLMVNYDIVKTEGFDFIHIYLYIFIMSYILVLFTS